MSNKRFKAVNRIAIFFTQPQMDFLNRMKKELGEGKSTIVRRAVNEFMYSELQKRSWEENEKKKK